MVTDDVTNQEGSPRRFATATSVTLANLGGELSLAVQGAISMEDAAQRATSFLFQQYRDSLALVRLFVVLPFHRLPAKEQSFARTLATRHGLTAQLGENTQVLTLLGSSGTDKAWNGRLGSTDHFAIPLLGAEFVSSVPMLAALLTELGVDLSWFDVPKEVFSRKLLGGFNGLFFVPDARTARDGQGRPVIPSSDFVKTQAVRSVFGAGGAYVNDSIMTAIFFTRETLTRAQAEQFSFVASTFKTQTARLVMEGALFSPADPVSPGATARGRRAAPV